ncbi:MAG: hypothetical protein PHR96_00755 [Clostridia bacterium]|nr:hypothetical protein [Clostridia bacterium]
MIKDKPYGVEYVSENLLTDDSFILDMCKVDLSVLSHIKNENVVEILKENPSFAFDLVELNGEMIEFFSDKIRNDDRIINKALVQIFSSKPNLDVKQINERKLFSDEQIATFFSNEGRVIQVQEKIKSNMINSINNFQGSKEELENYGNEILAQVTDSIEAISKIQQEYVTSAQQTKEKNEDLKNMIQDLKIKIQEL